MSASAHPVVWPSERRARELVRQRSELVYRLPREIRAARRLRPDVCELIVDDAIEFASLHYHEDVATASHLEAVFWSACVTRVQRAGEGRYELVRGRFTSVPDTALNGVVADDDPVADAEAAQDRALAHEFAATLDARERRILKAKYDTDGAAPAGYKVIARRLRLRVGAVRSAERSIERKIERFAAVYSAGRLCDMRAIAITSLAAGAADERQARVARAHVEHCAHCRPQFVRQMREFGSAAFERNVASLLPVADLQQRGRARGAWDAVVDLASRPFAHEPTVAAAQLAASGAGRGAGTIAALKIAGACMASAGAVTVCATTLVAPVLQGTPPRATATPTPTLHDGRARRGPRERRPSRAEQQVTPVPTPPPPTRRTQPRASRSRASEAKTQGGTGPTDHEQTPASPAPANAASDGSSEFDPLYQPSQPAQPAPVPEAPGSSEFF